MDVIKRLTRCDGTTDTEGTPMVADPPYTSAFPQPERGPRRPPGAISETDKHLRGTATVLGKFLPELTKSVTDAAETNTAAIAATGTHIEASIDQVATEISDLTAAVRELTELVKEMPLFPPQRWGKTRALARWVTQR